MTKICVFCGVRLLNDEEMRLHRLAMNYEDEDILHYEVV